MSEFVHIDRNVAESCFEDGMTELGLHVISGLDYCNGYCEYIIPLSRPR